MVKPKYKIESTIAMRPIFKRMIQQVDFNIQEIREKLAHEKCHIYMVCHRPRISINIEKTLIAPEQITLYFKVTNNEHEEEHIIKVENNLDITNINSKYPYTDVDFINKDGEIVAGGKVSFFYSQLMKNNNKYHASLDLKVLYIGQAFGENGERLAAHRLLTHSTLQEIYSDTIYKSPNHEVWLILLEFEPYLISAGGGAFENNSSLGNDETEKHLLNLLTTRIDPNQEITFTEAALIRYFQPIYNKEYKTSFPSGTHSSYNQCYKLDVNSVAFELQTQTDLFTRLYTDEITPNFVHTKHFPLFSQKERADMFKMI
ncbi:hypothetical protein [Bacillus sp. S56]|uniref:hypothetical protein n=1 Tax=Bacillus sp. S56 TaxID=1226987 RepID=UPI00190C6834|nr:hypothetical protein [Bacillus sp. S56]MBK0075556.1 hypothetical protein [Bacillus sp. S56]